MRTLRWLLVVVSLLTVMEAGRSAEPFELKDGDRVVWLGGTLIEREQRYGFWELALTARQPERGVLFRNLGWSGDTVFGQARAGFGSPPDGFKALKDQVTAVKPTVIIVNYGFNEAFDGDAGLERFSRQLDALLDVLQATKARVVVLGPPDQEKLPPPLPDPAEQNRRLKAYRDILRGTAEKHGHRFVDLADLLAAVKSPSPLTDNGVHFTGPGYRASADVVADALGARAESWRVEVDAAGKSGFQSQGTALAERTQLVAGKGLLSFWLQDRALPTATGRILKIKGLPDGKHTLLIDSKPTATHSAAEWSTGVDLAAGPEFEQAEKLRAVIVEKNQIYFHRWRPQNETYLFGFRKHEQGQNAREVPLFDPLAADQEREIARLRVPLPHLYEFVPEDKPLPGVPNPDPEEERKAFLVAPGFEVSLFAADPRLAKPIQMNFDPRGRLWVASSETYPQIKPGDTANDKVLILEDTKGQGQADKITVFADGLLIPTGLEPGDGGVYVANSTELLHLSDTNGDGKADQTRVVLSGFGTEDTHHLLHTLCWGHDGMLYFNQSIYIHSHIETPHGVRRLGGGGIWQLRPESLQLDVFARGWVNPWGHHFDRWGQSFATDGAGGEGINYVVPGAAYPTAVGVSQILHGLNPGSPKYCGLEVISGRHFPDDWQGNLIVNDFRAHRVCRFVLKEDGSGYTAKEMPELIKTNHAGFRPIDAKMGPDGALYIADWYNPIINHGEVDFRDPRRDHTHGRIWRVTAKGRPLVAKPNLIDADNTSLFESLKASEQWTRQQAKRVLKERGPKVLPDLAKWVASLNATDADHEHHLLEALWVQQSLSAVEGNLLKTLLRARDPHARAAAVRVLTEWHDRIPNALDLLTAAVADEHPQVRLEAVCTLRQLPMPRTVEVAMHALDRPLDKFLDYALAQTARELGPLWLPALQKGELTFGGNVRHLLYALQAVNSPQAVQTLVGLVQNGKVAKDQEENVLVLIAGMGGPRELGLILDRALATTGTTPAQQALLLTDLERAARERKVQPAGDLSRVGALLKSESDAVKVATARLIGAWKLDNLRSPLVEIVRAKEVAETVRQAAVDGLVLLGGPANKTLFEELAATGATPCVKLMAVTALTAFDLNTAAAAAIKVLRDVPATQDLSELFAAFIQRKTGPAVLAKALAGQKLSEDVAKVGIRAVRNSGRDAPEVVAALTKAGGLKGGAMVLTPAELQQFVVDVARLGDPVRGEAVYRRKDLNCLKCHAIAGSGGQVGPGLESLGAGAPVDYIVESLLAPNKAVKEGFHAVTVTTVDGKLFTGVKVRETKMELVLRTAEDKELTLRPDAIDETKPAASMMPEGLADTLTRPELLDLVRFLSELGKIGPFAVGKDPVVRTWQTLDATPEATKQVPRIGFAAAANGEAELGWSPAYSTVSGVLPSEALPALVMKLPLGTDTVTMAFVRCKLEVTTAGRVGLKLNGAAGLQLWVDGTPASVNEETVLDLPAGLHVLSFAVDLKQQPAGLRCELEEVPGSPARARIVGGK